jgi:hypothetical protein
MRPLLRLAHGGGTVLAFAAGLALGCWAIASLMPLPLVAEVTSKLQYLREHPRDFDTLIFGSSRMYHQIIPELFDQLTAEAGMPTKTFNASIDGMHPPELNYYVDEVLRGHPQGIKWVIIEANGLRLVIDATRRDTYRAVYWHDLPRMWLVIRACLARRRSVPLSHPKAFLQSFAGPLRDVSPHWAPFFKNFSNLGRASVFMDRLAEVKVAPDIWGLGDRHDGFITSGRPEAMSPAEQKVFEAEVAKCQTDPPRAEFGEEWSQRAFESMLAGFERKGARSVVVDAPTTHSRKFHLRSEATSGRVTLDFCDPLKYPELYEDRFRLDSDHLNLAGANYFTRLLVKQFCAAQAPAR